MTRESGRLFHVDKAKVAFATGTQTDVVDAADNSRALLRELETQQTARDGAAPVGTVVRSVQSPPSAVRPGPSCLQPTIDDARPGQVAPGDSVVLTGSDFGTEGTVWLRRLGAAGDGGRAADGAGPGTGRRQLRAVAYWSDSRVVVAVPHAVVGRGAYEISLRTPDGSVSGRRSGCASC